jgi:hypothetical protein
MNIARKIKYILLINTLLSTILYCKTCSNYFNPDRFYEAPEVLQDMLLNIQYKNKFIINKYELYKYDANSIAEEINDDFGGFWKDYIGEDGYEMTLIPEYNLFKYEHKYFSLKVTIYGIQGDATKYKNTKIKYSFYDYTNQVNEYKKCIKINKK